MIGPLLIPVFLLMVLETFFPFHVPHHSSLATPHGLMTYDYYITNFSYSLAMGVLFLVLVGILFLFWTKKK
jgi:hypothetical protein